MRFSSAGYLLVIAFNMHPNSVSWIGRFFGVIRVIEKNQRFQKIPKNSKKTMDIPKFQSFWQLGALWLWETTCSKRLEFWNIHVFFGFFWNFLESLFFLDDANHSEEPTNSRNAVWRYLLRDANHSEEPIKSRNAVWRYLLLTRTNPQNLWKEANSSSMKGERRRKHHVRPSRGSKASSMKREAWRRRHSRP